MERKEAIEIIRKLYNESLFLKKDKEAMVTLIPELAESEDEKIREALIKYFSEGIEYLSLIPYNKEQCVAWLEKQSNIQLPTFTFDDVLALQCCMETVKKVQEDKELYSQLQSLHSRLHDAYWLEKQGEHTDIPADAVLDSNKDGLIADTIKYKTEKQSVECSEDNLPEFESYLCLMFQKFRTKGVCTNGEIIDYVMEHAQKLKDTLCHAWSEEDELNLSEALHHIRMYNLANKADKLDKWLKTLKDRVQPQVNVRKLIEKLEWLENTKTTIWSIDDEAMFSKMIIEGVSPEVSDWVKSFKDRVQPQQELSEEDIETISRVISIVKWAAYSDHSHPILNDEGATELVERLNSLKDRVQPKQEWSEEDERRYRAAIAICNSLGHTDTANWLKFHKPQLTWKPVEYTHTDAFIDKASKFIKDNGNFYIDIVNGQLVLKQSIVKDFIKYMKEE